MGRLGLKRLSSLSIEQSSQAEMVDPKRLNITYKGDIWVVNAYNHHLVSEVMTLALSNYFDPIDSLILSKYKLIHTTTNKVLNPHLTVGDEELGDSDEIILTKVLEIGACVPEELTLQDTEGPTKEEVMLATLNLPKIKLVQVVPNIDCQEDVGVQKILYSLVEASAKTLSFNPDAKAMFDDMATHISAKSKKEIDKSAVTYLKTLGFTEDQARYALQLKRNRQIQALEWLLKNSDTVTECMNVASLSDASTSSVAASSEDPEQIIYQLLRDIRELHQRHFEPNNIALTALTEMGFSRGETVKALRLTDNNLQAACEWLCGERDPSVAPDSPGLSHDNPLYKALISNPVIQLGLNNPKVMFALLSILDNPSIGALWLSDADTAPVIRETFKTYYSEKMIMVKNQQLELLRSQDNQSNTKHFPV